MKLGEINLNEKFFWPFLGALVVPLLALISYVLLNTACKPYWSTSKFEVADDCYHSYYITNPGPYKGRKPFIEFLAETGGSIVGGSPGVDVTNHGGKLHVAPEFELPAGAVFFLTYKHPKANKDPVPMVVCDGKICKENSTMDNDMIMTLLMIIILLLVLVITALVYHVIRRWANERYIDDDELDQSAITKTVKTLKKAGGELSRIAKKSQPKTVK